jgi:chaperonin GroES
MMRSPIRGIAMGLKPIGDRIIVRREVADDKTAGGIVLPDTAKNKPQRGTIVAAGPGKLKKDGTRSAMQLKAGDKVLFTSWAGDEFKYRKAKLEGEILVMHESDVMCVIE